VFWSDASNEIRIRVIHFNKPVASLHQRIPNCGVTFPLVFSAFAPAFAPYFGVVLVQYGKVNVDTAK